MAKGSLKRWLSEKIRLDGGEAKPYRNHGSKAATLSILALGAATAGVFAANSSIYIPNMEFGSGVAGVPKCTSSATVNITESISGTITEYQIATVPPSCVGRWIRLSIYSDESGSGEPIEQIVWHLPPEGFIPFTLRADGETTGISGTTVWPSSEVWELGMKSGVAGISASLPRSMRLEVSDTILSDNY